MEELRLGCSIEGYDRYFRVSISSSQIIQDLAEKIYNTTPNFFTGRDRTDLILHKVNVDLDSVEDTISHGQYQPDVKDDPLRARMNISDVWPEPPPSQNLHVFVSLSSAVLEHPVKKRRLADNPQVLSLRPDDPVIASLRQFWNSLWNEQGDRFCEDLVTRGPNPVEGVDVPATMKVLNLSAVFGTIEKVMIRDEYDEAIKDIEGHKERKMGVVIVGHPGIGKTILLYYILVKRLLEKKPTVLQYKPNVVFIFNDKGLHARAASSYYEPDLSGYQGTWALVDMNEKITQPADFIQSSKFFLVMASSPTPSRWYNVQMYKAPVTLWFMKPFSLVELLQARQLQPIKPEEADIESFFGTYGPSPRDCYGFCSPDMINYYFNIVRAKVKAMTWEFITNILILQPEGMKIDEAAHRVLLVEPDPNNRAAPRAIIVTKAVSQLLWDRDSDALWQNHHQLFRTLLLQPNAKSLLGYLYEPAFHDLCIRGTTFTIYQITDSGSGPVNYKFTTDQLNPAKSEPLTLHEYTRISFNKDRPIDSLRNNCYYRPTTPNHPSYDSLIYDDSSRRISVFQVTAAAEHGLSPKGVRELVELGQRLHIENLKIRIIVVVYEDAQVAYKIEKRLFDALGLEVYVLQVTEHQLYGFPSP